MSAHRARITPDLPAQWETATAYLSEMRDRIRGLPEPDPHTVEAIVRDTIRRLSPTLLQSLAWHAEAHFLPEDDWHMGVVDALILTEQRRAYQQEAS